MQNQSNVCRAPPPNRVLNRGRFAFESSHSQGRNGLDLLALDLFRSKFLIVQADCSSTAAAWRSVEKIGPAISMAHALASLPDQDPSLERPSRVVCTYPVSRTVSVTVIIGYQ